ncbi:MAG: cytochrome P450 [Rhizobiaceae bacterium]
MADARPYDLISPAFQANPFPEFDRMRADGPVVGIKLPIVGPIKLAVTHDACVALLKDQKTFVRDGRNAGKRSQIGILQWLPRPVRVLADNMLGHDDPKHRMLRGLVDQAFARRGIDTLRSMIVDIADQLLHRLEGRREVDLMTEFCRDLPLSVICAMLGLPERDHPIFKRWMGGIADTANVWAVLRAIPGVLRTVTYVRKMAQPGSEAKPDGLIAALRDARIDGRRLSDDEMASMVFLLFAAGQETTTHLIGGGLHTLLVNREQRLRLAADPAFMPLAVEECLRHVSPVQMSKPRFAAEDTELAGIPIRRGEAVAALLSAANCDPAKFDDPHRFDIGRHPNPHIAFGTGVHFCLGFQLARVEAAIAFERFFARFPNAVLAHAEDHNLWRRRFGIRALASLPVRLSA